MKTKRQSAFQSLRRFALSQPETREDFPWGESAIKVRDKTFLFMRDGEEGLSLSVKLPQSHEFALEYPFTEPTGYGLGKSGWVTAKFSRKDKAPLDVLQAWIAESYRAVAPKALLKKLSA
ncbi:MAG TPA: MmcQ/YjbR family DNA-binding protein [Rhizomicrobium sp.]|jgi:predicted DNA-binding protein (MmcQ/YjbR family)